MNALCLVLEGENIALLTIVKDYSDVMRKRATETQEMPSAWPTSLHFGHVVVPAAMDGALNRKRKCSPSE